MKPVFASLILGALVSTGATASCPGHIRFIHGEPFRDQPVQIRIDGKAIASELDFRGVTDYMPIHPGKHKVEFRNSSTGEILESRSFVVGPNLGYSIAFAGPAKGPEGMTFGNASPFVFLDDISPVSNPQRWKGTWYRLSETNVVIDFRISDAADFTKELARLYSKPNRSTYQLGDFPAGTYQFHPVLPGSSEPFFNQALVPPRVVELTNIEVRGGENLDIIALGNFLGKAPNSLDLTYKKYTPMISQDGCIEIK